MDDFFNKLKDSIEKSAQVVTNLSVELVEMTKLKASLALLQEQRKKAYTDLGKSYYVMHKNNAVSPVVLLEHCNQIEAIEQQILEKEADLKKISPQQPPQDVRVCECGAFNVKEAKYCMYCGKKLDSE